MLSSHYYKLYYFWFLMKRPTPTVATKQRLKLLLKVYLWVWLFYFLFFAAVQYVSQWFDLNPESYQQTRLLEMLQKQPFQLVVAAVIIAPIFEELMFRALIKPTHPEILLFLSGWISFLSMYFSAGIGHWALRFLLMVSLFVLLYYVLQEIISAEKTEGIRRFLHQYVYVVLFVTSVIFGLAHIYNYVDAFLLNIALFVIVVPRIVLGAFAGWLKLKTGAMLWPILLHFLNNAFVILMMLWATYFST